MLLWIKINSTCRPDYFRFVFTEATLLNSINNKHFLTVIAEPRCANARSRYNSTLFQPGNVKGLFMKILEERFAVHVDDYKHYDTEKLRKHFLIENIFSADEVLFTYTHYERLMVGGAYPATKPVALETFDQLKSDFFLQRRELGAINVGGAGKISVDGETYDINTKEALYIGRGAKEVIFSSLDATNPAKFYLTSTPAHCTYPTKKLNRENSK